MDIVQMSISASVLIIAVVMIRALTLHKLPKKTFLFLWGGVLCRLLIPFSIPFRFSFYTGVDTVVSLLAERTAAPPTRIISNPGTMPIPDVGGSTGIGTSAATFSPLDVVWLSGLFVCGLFFIIAYIKCRREFKMSLPVGDDFSARWLQEHPLHRLVQIRQSDRIKAPLTYGVFRPVILLPKDTDWTDTVKLRYVLTHELTHIRYFDALTKLILTAAVCVHWFNPFVWAMYVLANRDIELSCDETVVKIFGETEKSAYALALIGWEERKSRFIPLVNNFSKNSIEERIVSIMKMKKTSLMGMILAFSLVVGTITVFATTADAANNPAPNNNHITSELSSGVVISGNDESGKPQISVDNGKTWMSEEEYNKAYPTPEVVWWTYEEYKEWLDNEKVQLQSMVGEKGWNPTEGWYVWTQERTDETIKMYEDVLGEIKNGTKVSKTVNGSNDIMLSSLPEGIAKTESYGVAFVNDGLHEVTFGPYATKEELLAVIVPYCKEQVEAGYMTQQEADEVIAKYQ